MSLGCDPNEDVLSLGCDPNEGLLSRGCDPNKGLLSLACDPHGRVWSLGLLGGLSTPLRTAHSKVVGRIRESGLPRVGMHGGQSACGLNEDVLSLERDPNEGVLSDGCDPHGHVLSIGRGMFLTKV